MEAKDNTRLYGMLGFAMRAGKVVLGTDLILTSLSRKGKGGARLVLICQTASDGTKEKIMRKSAARGVECLIADVDGEELGRLLGKLYAPAAVAITDEGFAAEIKRSLKGDS